jgi:phage repressor protein C with HTH and peptisase S24 domain
MERPRAQSWAAANGRRESGSYGIKIAEHGDGKPLRVNPGGQKQGLDAYIDKLIRAQEEQERLEEELKQEQLKSEFSLSNYKRRSLDLLAGFPERHSSLVRTTTI